MLTSNPDGGGAFHKRSGRIYLPEGVLNLPPAHDLQPVGDVANRGEIQESSSYSEKSKYVSGSNSSSSDFSAVRNERVRSDTDEEWNKYVARIMEFSLMKTKQVAARAFQEDLIGKLPGVVERQSLMQAGQLLDASARIYSFRVDATHSAAYEVRSQLGDDSKIKKTHTDEETSHASDREDEGAERASTKKQDAEEGSLSFLDIDTDKDHVVKKKKHNEYAEEDLPDAGITVKENMEILDFNAEKFLLAYRKRREMKFRKCQLRRAKMSCIVRETAEINGDNQASCSDHLYGKATRNFDEGSCAGLLMQNALIGDEGRRLLVHGLTGSQKPDGEGSVEPEAMRSLLERLEDITNTEFSDKKNVTSGSQKDCTVHSVSSSTSGSKMQKEDALVLLPHFWFDSFGYWDLFKWRMNFQREIYLSTKQFICLLEKIFGSTENTNHHLLLDVLLRMPSTSDLKALKAINREGQSAGNLFADSSLLSMFEESFNWIVFRQRWDSSSNDSFANLLSPSRKGNTEYNYFFARDTSRSDETRFKMDASFTRWVSPLVNDLANESVEETVTHLRQILEKCDVGGKKSLFQNNGNEDFNKTVSALDITVPSHSVGALHEIDVENAVLESAVEEETSFELLIDRAVMAEVSEPAEDNAHLSNTTLLELPCEDASFPVQNHEDSKLVVLSTDADQAAATGDLNYRSLDETVLAVSSIEFDDSHWIGRVDEGQTAKPGDNGKKKPAEKKRRRKAEKETPEAVFSFDDLDPHPLDVLERKFKSGHNLLTKDSNVLNPKNNKLKEIFQFNVFKSLGSLKNVLDFSTEGTILDHFFLDEWSKGRNGGFLEKENRHPSMNRSPFFLTLFDGCFDDECDELTAEKNSFGQDDGLGATEDSFFTEPEELDTQDREQIQVLLGDKPGQVEDRDVLVKYAARQRRINAQAVKRAISTVLSDKTLDSVALKKFDLINGFDLREDAELPIDAMMEPNSSLVLPSRRSLLNISADETELQLHEEEEIVEDPTREVHNVDISVAKIRVRGKHTFSSLLAYVPDLLFGRTAEDINPIDIFCILLHLCNENEFELIQRHNDLGMVLFSELGDFSIINSRGGGSGQKRSRQQ